MAIERDDFDAVDDASTRQPAPERSTPVNAMRVVEFGSIPLQTKLRAAIRAGTLRGSWRLSDRREVLLTSARCHVAEATGGKVWSAPYPSSAGTGLAVQCVMASAPGCDPFRDSGEEENR